MGPGFLRGGEVGEEEGQREETLPQDMVEGEGVGGEEVGEASVQS